MYPQTEDFRKAVYKWIFKTLNLFCAQTAYIGFQESNIYKSIFMKTNP